MMRFLFIFMFMAGPLLAQSEKIVMGLSQSSVSITPNFDGSEIMIYGAVKREAPLPKGPPMRVIMTIKGPDAPLVVRRKDRLYGIWLNNKNIMVDHAPSFYAVASSAPLNESLSQIDDLRYNITLPRAIRAVGITSEADNAHQFIDALLRIRQQEGAYIIQENSIGFVDETLFRTDIEMPANLTEGNYAVRIFLTRDGKVVDQMQRVIWVRKSGIERFFFQKAHQYPLLYGLTALLMALFSGWAASAVFARLKR